MVPQQGESHIRRDQRSQHREREPRINRRIRAREVMVIGADGSKLGAMPLEIALRRAEDNGLDLVEVAPEAKPPVCKIIDYGKQKYLSKKKQSEAKKNSTQQDIKEVKLRPKTDEHDFEFKIKHAIRFLKAGDKVRITLMFRGREVIHKDIAFQRLERIAKEVEGTGVVEVPPKMEQKYMFMILAPEKRVLARARSLAKNKLKEKEKEKEKAKEKGKETIGKEHKEKMAKQKIDSPDLQAESADPANVPVENSSDTHKEQM